MMSEMIAEYYGKGLFSKADIERFALIGWLTEEQKSEILEQE